MATSERRELAPVRLPYPADAEKYGYTPEVWRVLTEAIFPSAQSAHSVTLALAYCKARNLDVMKRPIHIVPIWDSKRKEYVETIWPGIGELRTTAARTGAYAGKDKTVFGPKLTENLGGVTVTFPEWAQVTVYRMVEGEKCPFVGPEVYWKESYATQKHDTDAPNTMWKDRPSGQLEKCAEAAALRLAFPEEIGNDYAAEEMEGRKFESFAKTAEGHDLGKAPPRPGRKSEAKKEAPPEVVQESAPASEPLVVPDQEAPERPADPEPQNGTSWRGKIAKCDVKKQGKRGDGSPYTLYAIKTKDGRTFETFSDTHADVASNLARTGEDAVISYKKDDYGDKATSVEVAGLQG